jgi:chemotaxis protein MotA
MLFFSVEGVFIVIGGTFAAAFIGYQSRYVLLALKEIPGMFYKAKVDRNMLTLETGKIIRWGYLVKKHGILALEREIKTQKEQDHFLNYGVELVITGYNGDEVRSMLGSAYEGAFGRAMVSTTILKDLGGNAPAFGMVGTLIGLVLMMSDLAGDPKAIGPKFALALLTTLYGVFLARIVFLPAASKYQQKMGILRFRKFLVTEGFAMLAEHKSPRYIQDRMNSFLDPSIHYRIDKAGAEGGGRAPARAARSKAAA